MNPLILGLGALGVGYLAYQYLTPEAKAAEGAPKTGGGGKTPPPAELVLPPGVKMGKTPAGGDLPYFEGHWKDLVLLALLDGQVAPTDATKPNGPMPIIGGQAGVLPGAFAFALQKSEGEAGRYILVPSILGDKLNKKIMPSGADAQIVATNDIFEIGMYAASGWASVAAPGELAWAVGLTDDEIRSHLVLGAGMLPSSGWVVSPTGAYLDGQTLTARWNAFTEANLAGSKDDFILTFTIERQNADGTTSRTSVDGKVIAKPGNRPDGLRVWPVSIVESPAFPRPEAGTEFEVPDTSILNAKAVPGV